MILVIGGTGNIGKSVVEGLLGKGQKVRVLTRDAKTAGQAFQQADVVQGDLDDAASLARAMEGAEKLFLVTPAASGSDQDEIKCHPGGQSGGYQAYRDVHRDWCGSGRRG